MRERFCELFDEPAQYKCITTNATIKVNGRAVMGAGCAGQLESMYPEAPRALADQIKKYGNTVNVLLERKGVTYLMFPVKTNWYEDADTGLIKASAQALMAWAYANTSSEDEILLPRPGCGNGHLDWESQVKPVIEPILSDQIVVVYNTFEG